MGEMKRIAQALEDYPPPPDRWTAPTAVEELARIRQEIKNADARQAQMSAQAYRAADMGDGPQAIAWCRKAGEAYERGTFWRDVLKNVTGTGAQVEAQQQPPPEGGDEEEAQLAGYAEQYERSQQGGA